MHNFPDGDMHPHNPRSPLFSDEREQDIELEVEDLLCPDRIMELDRVCVEQLMTLYANHRFDMCDLGEVIDRYMKAEARKVAEETV